MEIITNFSTLKTNFENKIFGTAKATSEVSPSKTIEQQIKDSLQDIVIKEIGFDYLTEATELNTLKTDGGIYEKNNSKINIGAICLTLSGVIVLLAILLIIKIRFNKKTINNSLLLDLIFIFTFLELEINSRNSSFNLLTNWL